MTSSPSIFESIIQPQHGTFSTDLAKYVLSLDFTPEQHARYEELSKKASLGELTADERGELEQLLAADAVLTILQSKARTSLQKHPTAA